MSFGFILQSFLLVATWR